MRIEWQIVFWAAALAFIGMLLWLFNASSCRSLLPSSLHI